MNKDEYNEKLNREETFKETIAKHLAEGKITEKELERLGILILKLN